MDAPTPPPSPPITQVTLRGISFGTVTAMLVLIGATASLYGPLLLAISHKFHVSLPQAVQAPVSERGEVALDGGASDPGDFGGFLPRQSEVQRPEDQHLFADPGVGMEGRALMLYDGLCGVCNTAVQWVIQRDHADRFRFAPQ